MTQTDPHSHWTHNWILLSNQIGNISVHPFWYRTWNVHHSVFPHCLPSKLKFSSTYVFLFGLCLSSIGGPLTHQIYHLHTNCMHPALKSFANHSSFKFNIDKKPSESSVVSVSTSQQPQRTVSWTSWTPSAPAWRWSGRRPSRLSALLSSSCCISAQA